MVVFDVIDELNYVTCRILSLWGITNSLYLNSGYPGGNYSYPGVIFIKITVLISKFVNQFSMHLVFEPGSIYDMYFKLFTLPSGLPPFSLKYDQSSLDNIKILNLHEIIFLLMYNLFG